MKSPFIVLVACLAAFSLAQSSASFDYQVSNILILQLKSVQREIGLTTSQHQRLKSLGDAFDAKEGTILSQERAKLKAQGKKYAGDMGQAQITAIAKNLKKQVLAVLTPKQIKRLGELSLQNEGLVAIFEEDAVRTRLNISVAQATTLRDAYKQGLLASQKVAQKHEEPVVAKFKPKVQQAKTQAQQAELRKEFEAQIQTADAAAEPELNEIAAKTKRVFNSTLTATQMAGWKALLGTPFKPH
jgi:ribosomal protein L3